MSQGLHILLAAGGTGGHVFPAIAIADALRDLRPDAQIEFVGTREKMEWIAVPQAGYPINPIWISGFHRNLTLKNLSFPFKLITSIVQSFRILKGFKPDVVICCGGYAAGPIGWAAARKGIPLFLQEQNSFPGVTNRLLAEKAKAIFTAFSQARDFFPSGKTHLYGNPTRKSLREKSGKKAFEFFNFDSETNTLLVLGGSGGAKSINEAMIHYLDYFHNELGLQIIWQCGARYLDKVKAQINIKDYKNLRLHDFIDRMPYAFEVADVVISRAGASSCAELLVTGTPSILIPSPHVAGDHQTKNAKAMQNQGASLVVVDGKAKQQLGTVVHNLFEEERILEKMSRAAKDHAPQNAANKIAEHILSIVEPEVAHA